MALRLLATCDSLADLPERGRHGLVPGTRELTTVSPYVIVYRIGQDTVEVVRIWHHARDRGLP
jgi:plasmid stabilization system protein ParE